MASEVELGPYGSHDDLQGGIIRTSRPTRARTASSYMDLEEDVPDEMSSQSCSYSFRRGFHATFFPGVPEHYPLKKKIMLVKSSSASGMLWDFLQVFLSILACGIYIAETELTRDGEKMQPTTEEVFRLSELAITQIFLIDFFLNWFLSHSWKEYWTSVYTMVDVLTILPVYYDLFFHESGGGQTDFSFFRFVKILRLLRILRAFKFLRNLSGVQRQIITLSLTMLSLTFLAAGIIQLLESDLNFFRCFYFIIVTVSTVGYGDISMRTPYGQAVVIIFIVVSLVLIPLQVNHLQHLLSMRSRYRSTFTPEHHADSHVILTGHVQDRATLTRFFQEMFHPDRMEFTSDVHVVIMSPTEPPEEIASLLVSPVIDMKVTYVVGSVLNSEDLKRARADAASAIFFMVNKQTPSTEMEDAANILRTLSVNNYYPKTMCFVQILRPEEKRAFKDSDVEMLLCLDELKTVMQARNAMCPGFSTMLENLFHSFGVVSVQTTKNTPDGHWLQEYTAGARLECYYLKLTPLLLNATQRSFSMLAEGLLHEFGVLLIGVANKEDCDVMLNPSPEQIEEYEMTPEDFYTRFNVGIIIADDQHQAYTVYRATLDELVVDRIRRHLMEAERQDPLIAKHSMTRNMDKRARGSIMARQQSHGLRNFVHMLKAAGGGSFMGGFGGANEEEMDDANESPYQSYLSSIEEEQSEISSTDDGYDAGFARPSRDGRAASQPTHSGMHRGSEFQLWHNPMENLNGKQEMKSSVADRPATAAAARRHGGGRPMNPLQARRGTPSGGPRRDRRESEDSIDSRDSFSSRPSGVMQHRASYIGLSNSQLASLVLSSNMAEPPPPPEMPPPPQIVSYVAHDDTPDGGDGPSSGGGPATAQPNQLGGSPPPMAAGHGGALPAPPQGPLDAVAIPPPPAAAIAALDAPQEEEEEEEGDSNSGSSSSSSSSSSSTTTSSSSDSDNASRSTDNSASVVVASVGDGDDEDVFSVASTKPSANKGLPAGRPPKRNSIVMEGPAPPPPSTTPPPPSGAATNGHSTPHGFPTGSEPPFPPNGPSSSVPNHMRDRIVSEPVRPSAVMPPPHTPSPPLGHGKDVKLSSQGTKPDKSVSERGTSESDTSSSTISTDVNNVGSPEEEEAHHRSGTATGRGPPPVAEMSWTSGASSSSRATTPSSSVNINLSSVRSRPRSGTGAAPPATRPLASTSSTAAATARLPPLFPPPTNGADGLGVDGNVDVPGSSGSNSDKVHSSPFGVRRPSGSSQVSNDSPPPAFGTEHGAPPIRGETRELDGPVLESQFLHNAQHVCGHIVICGSMDNVELFVAQLRREEFLGTGDYRPVVILCPQEPSKVAGWRAASKRFMDVFYVQGSPRVKDDLRRANVCMAWSLCLLSSRQDVREVEGESIDADTLLTFLRVERTLSRYPTVFFCVELTCPSNMGVLNSTLLRRQDRMTRRSLSSSGLFASGGTSKHARRGPRNAFEPGRLVGGRQRRASLVHTDDMDPMQRRSSKIRQWDLKTKTKKKRSDSEDSRDDGIMSEKTKKAHHSTKKKEADDSVESFWDVSDTHHLHDVFASGRSYVPSAFETLLCQAYYGPLSPTVCEKFLQGEGNGIVFQVEIPIDFVGSTFTSLFRHFLFKNVLPFALYRINTPDNRALLPYVYTAPDRHTRLHAGDRVYILASKHTLHELGEWYGLATGSVLRPDQTPPERVASRRAPQHLASHESAEDHFLS